MKFTKVIPERKVVFEATALTKNFMMMTPRFRQIRSKSRKPMDKCYFCKHEFVDGEMMALAIATRGNQVLCQSCASDLEKSE